MSQLGDALFTTTQQKVLGLLYTQPGKSFYTKEILRLTGMGVATIKRELDRMVAASILTMTKIGNQHHYQANPECPIYQELLAIVRKTFGISDAIGAAFISLANRIHWLFIFGSLASGKDRLGSDIDLMIIGDVSFSEVVGAVYPIQEALGREINPKVYAKEEWERMLNGKDAFIQEVLAKPKLTIMGGESGLG